MIADDAAVQLARRAEAHASLYWFTRYGFQQQYKRRWLRNWHHEAICDRLQRVYDGQCRRLIINIPPRYSKTEIAVVNFMAWALGRQPDAEFIHTSYSARLAVGNSARCRQLVRTKWYRALFPALRLAVGSSAKEDWRTTAGGVIYATGAGGTITGYGAGKKRDVPSFGGAILIDEDKLSASLARCEEHCAAVEAKFDHMRMAILLVIPELQRAAPYSPALKQARDLLGDALPITIDLPERPIPIVG